MKAWSAAVLAEVVTWSSVSSRSFFGLTALYRKTQIFALLPRTRAIESPTSLAFKFENPSSSIRRALISHPRINTTHLQTGSWFTLELSSDADLNEALRWLDRAYQAAASSRKTRYFR